MDRCGGQLISAPGGARKDAVLHNRSDEDWIGNGCWISNAKIGGIVVEDRSINS